MVEAPRLPGQDGKTLTGRHARENKEGRSTRLPLQGGGKGLFSGCARAFLRNNEDQFRKWEKGAEIRELEGISSHIYDIFSCYVGRLAVLGQSGRNCFW